MIVRFPKSVVQELSGLCRENAIGKTEFIQIAIRQLAEYIEHYAPHEVQLKMQHAEREWQRREQEKARAAAIAAGKAAACPDSLLPDASYEGQEEEEPLPVAAEDELLPYAGDAGFPREK